MRQDELGQAEKALAAVVPGATRTHDTDLMVMRRMRTEQSQRGRSAGWEGALVRRRRDILAAPSQGLYT